MAYNETQKEQILVDEEEEKEIEQLIESLPKADFMGCKNLQLIKYQNFWFFGHPFFKNLIRCQKHYDARDSDLIVASHPKSGTTWLSALLYEVVNRNSHHKNESPLLCHNPHQLVRRLEYVNYGGGYYNHLTLADVNEMPSPRLFSTHFPYTSLPESIKNSGCRILYICRNPLDTFVSQWTFFEKGMVSVKGDRGGKLYGMEDYFQDFCEGRIWYGPFFEHIIDYWKQSLEKPHKVLFLKYEDLKENPRVHLKRIADFVGIPFSVEEENGGVISQIIEMCNIKNIKDANKDGTIYTGNQKKEFFRKGEVGDWVNYFSPSMVDRINMLMQQKFQGTGLTFKLLP